MSGISENCSLLPSPIPTWKMVPTYAVMHLIASIDFTFSKRVVLFLLLFLSSIYGKKKKRERKRRKKKPLYKVSWLKLVMEDKLFKIKHKMYIINAHFSLFSYLPLWISLHRSQTSFLSRGFCTADLTMINYS